MKIKNRKSCPVCGGGDIKHFINTVETHGKKVAGTKKKYNYLRCLKCEAIFLNEVTLENEIYRKHYLSIDENCGFIKSNIENIYSYMNNSAKKWLIFSFVKKRKKKSILDIGCGNGLFLNSFSDDWEKYGTDLLKNKRIKGGGHVKYLYGDVLKINFKKRYFSAITMWHVLEHISDPVKLLNKSRKFLRKNGCLFLSTPNSSSYGMSLGKENWFHLDAPRHLVIYNKRSIQALLERTGYHIIKEVYYPFEFPLDLYWSIRKSRCRHAIYLLYPIFKLFDKETIVYVLKRKK